MNSRDRGSRILVVGAGVSGLAAARSLVRSGFRPEVVERSSVANTEGTGVYLPGNAAQALRALGLERDVIERSVPIPAQRFHDFTGRLLGEVDVNDVWRDVGPCVGTSRSDLHTVLLAGADGASIRSGVSPRALRSDDGGVHVEFGDGTAQRYDLVVGADGIHSTVRRLMFGENAFARPVGQVGWRFVTERPSDVTTWSVLLGSRTAFLMVPISDDKLYCYCDVTGSSGADTELDVAALFQRFADPVPALAHFEARGEAVHQSVIEEVALDTWVRDRVVLIGDAAHATSPNMAQGAAMALEDAVVLPRCLASHATITDALSAFEATRRPRTDWVRAQTHRRDRIRYLPRIVRNAALRTAGDKIYRSNYGPLLRPYLNS